MSRSSPPEKSLLSVTPSAKLSADADLCVNIDSKSDTKMPAIPIVAGDDARSGAIASQEIIDQLEAGKSATSDLPFGLWLLANQGTLSPDFDLDI